jgi:uncharacterized SAM-binding protein YcdF (DUF218 family)
MSSPRAARPIASSLARWAAALGGALAMLAAAWALGLVWFVRTTPRETPPPEIRTDVIVVLTGGSERLTTGLDLLERGSARRVFVSGVHRDVDVRDLLRAANLPANYMECCLVLGHAADDTIGNAAETAEWIRREGLHSLRLVTANYHMRRSLLEFRQALPEADIVPHPVAPASVRLDAWWRWPGTLKLLASEYTKFLAAVVRAVWTLDFHALRPTRPPSA